MRRALALVLVLLCGGAQADELTRYTTPAERARGCVFAERFESQAFAESNGATIVGTPTFSPVTGVDIDPGTDELYYTVDPTIFNHDPISVVIVFYPDFDYTENAIRYLYDTGATTYHVLKTNDAGNHGLEIRIGGSMNVVVPEGTYGPYWRQGERNTLVISGTTGDTSAWLNKQLIIDADATAWTGDDETELTFGINFSDTYHFDGVIESFQVYHAQLTAGESDDFSDCSTYTWENRATAHYQMRLQDHDATNTTTIDSTGKAGDLTLVHAPVKTTAHGYDFDGTNDYLSGTIDSSTFNSAEILIVMEFTPDQAWGAAGYDEYLLDADVGGVGRYYVLKNSPTYSSTLDIALGNTAIASIASGTWSPYWLQNQRNVLIISSSATTDLTDVWLNGALILDGDTSAWTQTAPDDLHIGSRFNGTDPFDGKIHSFLVAPVLATELQALDIDHAICQRGNDQ